MVGTISNNTIIFIKGRRGWDSILGGFTTTFAISVYHNWKVLSSIAAYGECIRYNIML